eukprot:1368295-Amphidinium_carterae.1
MDAPSSRAFCVFCESFLATKVAKQTQRAGRRTWMGSTSSVMAAFEVPGDTQNKSHDTKITPFAGQGTRSTSSPFTRPSAYTDIDGGSVCVRGSDGEVVNVCATSTEAHPTQLLTHQPWQLHGAATTEHVRAELW